jgi:hypothetical protein
LVDTSFREVDQTHCVIDVADVASFNHIVVSDETSTLKQRDDYDFFRSS